MMMHFNDTASLDVRLKGAARVLRFAAMGIAPSQDNARAGIEAVRDAREFDEDAGARAGVAELALNQIAINGTLPKQNFCKTAAQDIDVMALAVAQCLADRPAIERPRG